MGYKNLYKQIWSERKFTSPVGEDFVECSICDIPIYESELSTWHFSHLRSKGARPDLKLNPKNIVIKCKQCHGQEHASGKFNNYLGK